MNSNKKNKNKLASIIKIFLVLLFVVVTPNYVYASAVNTTTLTESEIKEAIDNRGDGDIPTQAYLILWFFVAFGFLKVSQKMDSHLSSLGINVGQTGGSLIGEAVSVAKGLQSAASGFNSKGGGSSSMFGGSDIDGKKGAGFLQGGLAGTIGRKTFQSGQTVATGGSASTLGGSKFTRELESGSGDFANNVIGSIAQGNLKNDGSITGETASKAMDSYFGLIHFPKTKQNE